MSRKNQVDIDKFFEEGKEFQKEINRLRNKVEEYKNKFKSEEFELILNWEIEITRIDLSVLKTPLVDDLKNNLVQEQEIVILDLEKVLARYCNNDPDAIYPKNTLFTTNRDVSIARLIEHVEKGVKIIPPLIKPFANGDLSVIDGNHRLALSRYLELIQIPFIVPKKCVALTSNLV